MQEENEHFSDNPDYNTFAFYCFSAGSIHDK